MHDPGISARLVSAEKKVSESSSETLSELLLQLRVETRNAFHVTAMLIKTSATREDRILVADFVKKMLRQAGEVRRASEEDGIIDEWLSFHGIDEHEVLTSGLIARDVTIHELDPIIDELEHEMLEMVFAFSVAIFRTERLLTQCEGKLSHDVHESSTFLPKARRSVHDEKER
ncbi:MAG: hypothetical protein WBB23_04260 [Desulforhopalus sp.]